MSVEHFDAIIVGSGFGGSVMAYRLAEAGLRVVVLERGKAYPPGSFPRTPYAVRRNFWDPATGLHGLYHVHTFPRLVAVTAAGLGGGSLIYANVSLRKEERWFVDEDPKTGRRTPWPVDRAGLDPHYNRVEAMLRPTPLPVDQAPHLRVPRCAELDGAARRLGLVAERPPLAITFSASPGAPPTAGDTIHEAHPNLHGVPRRTCRACAECCIGCNEGSKNSLDLNYLSAARRLGAEIRTRCEVRGLAHKDGGGYTVTYVEHLPEREGVETRLASLPLRTLSAPVVVLAAGTFGSTEILLRSRDALGRFGDTLGARFSSNGDRLSFLERAKQPDGAPRALEPTMGPVITTSIRVPGAPGEPGYLVQDAGVPVSWAWAAEATQLPSGLGRFARFVRKAAARALGLDHGTEVATLFPDGAFSSSALPLLAMGEDVPSGRLRLRDGALDLDWNEHASIDLVRRMRKTERAVAGALEAELHEDPLSLVRKAATSHPLGGCAMAHDPSAGVVDEHGEVFGHPGLFVADGAVMPGATGDNPSLTIAALSDRFADHIVSTYKPPRKRPPPEPRRSLVAPSRRRRLFPRAGSGRVSTSTPAEARLCFTEEMRGEIAGPAASGPISFRLTIVVEDLPRFLADPAHEAVAFGAVRCEALGGDRPVVGGRFKLMEAAPGGQKRMRYRLPFAGPDDEPLVLAGVKYLVPGHSLWADTTTLYTRILGAGEGVRRLVVASGVMRLDGSDFMKQLGTFRSKRPLALWDFGSFFMGSLFKVYGAPRLGLAAAPTPFPDCPLEEDS